MATKQPRPPVEPPAIRGTTPEEAAQGRANVAQAKANAHRLYTPEHMEAARVAGEATAIRRMDNLYANDEMRAKQKRGEIVGPRTLRRIQRGY